MIRHDPYLRLQHPTLFVRDQDESLRFFVVADHGVPAKGRWVAIAPRDGTAILAFVSPRLEDEEYKNVGQGRQIVFLTEDVVGKYRE